MSSRVAVLVVLVAAALAAPAFGETLRIDRSRFLLDPSPEPPAGLAAAPAIALPDRWRESRPGQGGSAWYRFELPSAPAGEALAVHLPTLNMNAAVWLNGAWVGECGSFVEPVAHCFNRPLLVPFSGRLLGDAGNVVDVRLHAYANNYGELGPIEVGDAATLRARYEARLFWRADLARWCTALAGLGALFIGALFVGTRLRSEYGWFALALLLWTAASLNYWVRDIPVAHFAWERFVHGSLAAFIAVIPIWAHRFLGLQRPWLERAAAAYGVIGLLVIALVPDGRFYAAANAVLAVGIPVGAYLVYLAIARAHRLHRVEQTICIVGAVGSLLLAGHDLAIQLDWLPSDRPRLLVVTATLMLGSFGAALVARFLRAFARAEDRNVELERDRAVSRERERIMREVHDGVGATLVTTLAMVETGEDRDDLAAAIRSAIDDMRLVVDSIDPGIRDLNALLAQLRARLDPVVDRHELGLEWETEDLPTPVGLGPHEFLHILRIAQEAVANAIRHAGGGRIRITARPRHEGEAAGVEIAIRDDGAGLTEATTPGRGLANMRARAGELGGRLRVEAASPGTRVSLWLPLTHPSG